MTTIYHNPRCSKSRAALALLTERGIAPRVIKYLDEPPDTAQLKKILSALNLSAHDLIRTGEAAYRELNLSAATPDSELLTAITAHPQLLQRPIILHQNRAVIGRPPENVLELL